LAADYCPKNLAVAPQKFALTDSEGLQLLQAPSSLYVYGRQYLSRLHANSSVL